MDPEVKINVSVGESIRGDLKKIAAKKGMKFHAYIAKELEKIRNREIKK